MVNLCIFDKLKKCSFLLFNAIISSAYQAMMGNKRVALFVSKCNAVSYTHLTLPTNREV